MTSSTVVASSHTRTALRDPVLVLPFVVAAGLGIGWLGSDAKVSGTRVAVDLALAWALVGASLLALGRARWRRSRVLLIASAFALLAADLRWARADSLWTLGFLLELLWLALLVHFVLTFPDGRARSNPARVVIAGTYAAALGGLVVGALVDPRPRDVLGVAASERLTGAVDRTEGILGIAIAVAVVLLVARRLPLLQGAARRAQAPLLAAAALTVPTTLLWLVSVTVTGEGSPTLETIARGVGLLVPLGLVAGVTWSRMGRSEASDLVVELQTEGAASLGERLARALGDPTLELAYRLDDGRYVDATGQPVELPQHPNRAVTPLTARGEEVAALVHDPALLDEPAVVESVRATVGLVLENERLAAEVRSQLAEVRASRARIVAATDAERRRIERNLHDGAQQRLVTLSIALGLEASRAHGAKPDVLSRAQDEVEEAIAELRELARGIHPTLLREEGLEAAVEALARRTPLPVIVEGSIGDRLPDAVELAAYFLVSEALTNVVKHASASEATVRLAREAGTLRVVVTDDGVGGAHLAADSGLAGLRDRLEALDAQLLVESKPRHGTSINAEIPCGS
ncbi:MAG: sensor histidine kinase [Actinobacteria bacterium]|nr:MAG: sensor histidine kinase [Actinomycetota bacterium]